MHSVQNQQIKDSLYYNRHYTKESFLLYLTGPQGSLEEMKGRVVRIFGTNTDITDARRTAEELRKLTTELSEADRRKDEFLATLTHELRNPLAPIRNGLQVLGLADDDRVASAQVLTMMERNSGKWCGWSMTSWT